MITNHSSFCMECQTTQRVCNNVYPLSFVLAVKGQQTSACSIRATKQHTDDGNIVNTGAHISLSVSLQQGCYLNDSDERLLVFSQHPKCLFTAAAHHTLHACITNNLSHAWSESQTHTLMLVTSSEVGYNDGKGKLVNRLQVTNRLHSSGWPVKWGV